MLKNVSNILFTALNWVNHKLFPYILVEFSEGNMVIGKKCFSLFSLVLKNPRVIVFIEDEDGNRNDLELRVLHPFSDTLGQKLTFNSKYVIMNSIIDDYAIDFYLSSLYNEFNSINSLDSKEEAISKFENLEADEKTVFN